MQKNGWNRRVLSCKCVKISGVPVPKKRNRFTDERLIRLVSSVRTSRGQLLQNEAWEALVQRQIRLSRSGRAGSSGAMRPDPRLVTNWTNWRASLFLYCMLRPRLLLTCKFHVHRCTPCGVHMFHWTSGLAAAQDGMRLDFDVRSAKYNGQFICRDISYMTHVYMTKIELKLSCHVVRVRV